MTDRTVVYRLRAEAQQFQAQMAAAGASVRKAAGDMTSANKEGDKFRRGLDTLGGAAGKVGLVAAAGLGAAIVKAANFDQAMSNIKAATHESASAMNSLRAAALKAGADTAFSATEAASGIEELAKAGVATRDILGGGLAGALDLAAAGGLGVAEASETAATALTQFKLQGEDVPHVADLLAAAAGKAQGSVSDMGMALKQSGLVASQVGLTIEETTGTLAAFASAGLIGSDAGTSFKTMLQSLTPSSTKAADAMAAMGFSAYDAQGNFKGMTTVAADLRAGLSTMSKEQQNATLKTIFGSDAVRAAAVIYEQGGDGIQSWIDKTNDSGYAAETAATKLDNLKGDLEALGGSLETALIGTGDGAQGPLRSLTQGLTSAVNAYNNLGAGAKSGVAVTLGATAALGGGLFVFSKMVQSIAATRTAMTQLGVSATTTSKLMTGLGKGGFALAGLAAGALAAEELRKALEESLPGMSELSGQILAISEGKVASLGEEFDSLSGSIKRMADPDYIHRSSDAITGLLTLGILDGKEIDGARQEIDALDAALANLASTGGTDVATKAFDDLAKAQGLTAAETKQLLSILPGYKEALATNENQATLTGSATEDLALDTDKLAGTFVTAGDRLEDFKDLLKSLNEELQGRANVRNYEAALDDFTEGLKENGKTFDINTEKGRANQAALDNIAGSALQVAETMRGAARQKFLTNAIDDLRTMGNNLGLPQSEIKRLIGLLKEAHAVHVKPKIDVDAVAAMTAIERIRNALLGIKDKSVTVRVTQTGAGLTPGFGPQANARGGYITGPGTGTSDSIPSYLSNGEYVVKAAAVSKYGTHMFDRLNAMHFATGGKVEKGKRKATGGLSAFDNSAALEVAIDRLSDRLEAQTDATDREIDNRDQWASKMADVAQATTSGFNSDLFGSSGNPWAAGAAGGPLGALTKDIAGLNQRGALQTQLAGAGLSGDALAALLSQGSNSDIAALLASGQVSQYADLYAQRAALQGSVGAAGGQAAYGTQFAYADQRAAASQAALDLTNAQLAAMQGKLDAVRDAVERASDRTGDRVGAAVSGPATRAIKTRGNGKPGKPK